MSKIVRNIPNILTIIRILLTPFIIYLSVIDNINLCIILIIIGALTDLFDGLIARKFKLTSKLGAKLDATADKLFNGCLVITLLIKKNLFVLCLIGELLIAIINIFSYIKKRHSGTKYIGKIKTTVLFITVCLGFLELKITEFNLTVNLFIFATFILQILCCICYINCFRNFNQTKKTS